MSYIKKPEEVRAIVEGGKHMGAILEKLAAMVRPGLSALELDKKAEQLIRESGGSPAFKGYQPRRSDAPFPTTICASLNDELVHGIPTKDKIPKAGDIFSIDIGMKWRGFYTDTALTVGVGSISPEAQKLLDVTREALEVGIRECVVGNTVADIGLAIERYVKSQGKYGIVRDLVGHGVGHAVHEDPRVPNYYDKSLSSWTLEPGVVIAIEPMITLGSRKVVTADDGWTILTEDKSLCAHFEHTVVITADGPIVATRRPSEISSQFSVLSS